MRRLIWFLGLGVAGVWTLLTLGAYALVSSGGDWLILQSDQLSSDPESVVWIAWMLDLAQTFGVFVLVLIWAVVAAVILGIAALLARLVPNERQGVSRMR